MSAETTPGTRLKNVATHTAVREELRERILKIVEQHGQLSDVAIWRASAPDYLPWSSMIEEIKAMDKDKKLRLEIVAPGHWIIYSLASAQTKAVAVKKTKQAGRSKRGQGDRQGGGGSSKAEATTALVKTPGKVRQRGGTRSGKAT